MNRLRSAPDRQRFKRRLRNWVSSLLILSSATGCSRQFWRRQADRDVYDAVAQKLTDPRWAVPRVDITADPRSRFYDPYDLDRPPLPPDDPAAHTLMHWVDGWQGYKGWHQFGDLLSVENPQWLAAFGLSPDMLDPATGQPASGQMPSIENLTLHDALELSLIHNRDYQFQIETVYIAALAVTFERFQFGVRYLGTFGEPEASLTSRTTPDGIDTNDGVSGTGAFGVSQLLPGGAQWMVELTNNTLWLFSGGNQTSTASTLSYSITQPLFLGAGRKVVLEALTLTERALLYATRDLARFRQQFFTDVVATSQSISYFGLLQSRQQILNQEANLRRLERQVQKLQAVASRGQDLPIVPILDAENNRIALPADFAIPPNLSNRLIYDADMPRLRWAPATPMTEEDSQEILAVSEDPLYQAAALRLIQQVRNPVTSLDVLQILTQYINAQNTLRNSERNYQDNLDTYKIDLGLPPTIPVTLDLELLRKFELIDPILNDLEYEADILFSDIWNQASPPAVFSVDPDAPPAPLDPDNIRMVASEFRTLLDRVEVEGMGLVQKEAEIVRELIPGRLAELEDHERERLEADFDRDQRVLANTQADFENLMQLGAQIEEELNAPRFTQEQLLDLLERIKSVQEDLVRLVRTLTVIEVGLRVEMIKLNEFEGTEEECITIALQNRVDLMNARARVMDARRRIEVAANRLQASMALVAEGDFGTSPGNNPFAFNGDDSQIRFGVRFKAPLDQIAERNAYRAALIEYQREKRSYMLFEDGVKQQVRRALRGINVQKRNLETARGAVRRAAMQYDATNEQTDDPARAMQQASSNGGLQGQNVISSLNSILQAQNQLVATWFDYERNRLNLFRDMGTMVIGPDGVWEDPFYRNLNNDSRSSTFTPSLPPGPAGDIPPWDSGDGLGGDDFQPELDGVPPAPEE